MPVDCAQANELQIVLGKSISFVNHNEPGLVDREQGQVEKRVHLVHRGAKTLPADGEIPTDRRTKPVVEVLWHK